jgi:hypothetical protein
MKKMLLALVCLTLCFASCGHKEKEKENAPIASNGEFSWFIQKWAVSDISFVNELVSPETEAAAIAVYGAEEWRESLYNADLQDLKDATITLDTLDNFSFEKIFDKEFTAKEVDVLVRWRIKAENPNEIEFESNIEGSPKFIGIFDKDLQTLVIKKGYINITFKSVAPEEVN